MSKEMLINAIEDEECRIAIVQNGILEELYIERASDEGLVGNIYKARVSNVEPSIQAAFVDFGQYKNGFLHASDICPSLIPPQKQRGKEKEAEAKKTEAKPASDRRDRHSRGKRRVPIQQTLQPGQEILIQVTKDGIGTKGPSITTYLSLPGRHLVLMPHVKRLGVSRKIKDFDTRKKLRDMLISLDPPKDMGFIIRTAGHQHGKRDVNRDLQYLLRLWKLINNRAKGAKAPVELYRESDLVVRALRDTLTPDIDQVLVDSESIFRRVREFLKIAMPRYVSRAKLYESNTPLFHKYKIEPQINTIYGRTVPLASGGSIVIEQTEALVAIDVNSGRGHRSKDPEESAYKLNIEAARETVRQLRLRDLGGVIVIDFVDMLEAKHRSAVEQVLKEGLGKDRARTQVGRTSRFGIIEMTRQRVRPSLERSTFVNCENCRGTGVVKPPEAAGLDVLRQVAAIADMKEVA
ncbi:MAG: Rne/Rng family ribonuclease, partial [Planctomycetia bacterium]|nr:Rne/Rng family ribonuclease [Planctomycetia bacterium]